MHILNVCHDGGKWSEVKYIQTLKPWNKSFIIKEDCCDLVRSLGHWFYKTPGDKNEL